MEENASYNFFELFTAVEGHAYETTLNFYENYVKTGKGKVARAFNTYDHEETIKAITRSRSNFIMKSSEIENLWVDHYIEVSNN